MFRSRQSGWSTAQSCSSQASGCRLGPVNGLLGTGLQTLPPMGCGKIIFPGAKRLGWGPLARRILKTQTSSCPPLLSLTLAFPSWNHRTAHCTFRHHFRIISRKKGEEERPTGLFPGKALPFYSSKDIS